MAVRNYREDADLVTRFLNAQSERNRFLFAQMEPRNQNRALTGWCEGHQLVWMFECPTGDLDDASEVTVWVERLDKSLPPLEYWLK